MMKDKTRHNSTLSAKQLRALPILLSSRSVVEGCRKASISRDVFYLWMKTEAFRQVYEKESVQLVQSSIDSLKLAGNKAVTVLNLLLDSKNPTIRFRAACRIIDSLEKFIEFDIGQRLAELEARVEDELNERR